MCRLPMFTLIPRTAKDIAKNYVSAPPLYPVIIGNVRGACEMLPDPDRKAENQREARARTSACNNNDGDNQGGNMPS